MPPRVDPVRAVLCDALHAAGIERRYKQARVPPLKPVSVDRLAKSAVRRTCPPLPSTESPRGWRFPACRALERANRLRQQRRLCRASTWHRLNATATNGAFRRALQWIPPATGIRFSFSFAKNAKDWLSGDQNGESAPSVPSNSTMAVDPRSRRKSFRRPFRLALNTTRCPSGEILTVCTTNQCVCLREASLRIGLRRPVAKVGKGSEGR